MQALSEGLAGEGGHNDQVEQLRSELQQRTGQLQKLNADLEYSQEELKDLQRHCRSLEVVAMPMPMHCLAGSCRRILEKSKT